MRARSLLLTCPATPLHASGSGLEFTDKKGVKHSAVPTWSFVAADGVEMPLEEGTSAFITMNPGYIGRAGAGCGMGLQQSGRGLLSSM